MEPTFNEVALDFALREGDVSVRAEIAHGKYLIAHASHTNILTIQIDLDWFARNEI